jgi:prepilin-type N-terminal cleavage/methylation domain-containing protein
VKNKASLNSGFSLIELLVVLLIIAILAALCYLSYDEIVQRSRLVQQQTDMREIVLQIQQYRIGKGVYPADAQPGISPSDDPLYPVNFPYRDNYLYDYDYFKHNCQEWVKTVAYPRNQTRIDPYLEPGIVGQWTKNGSNLSYTINARKIC